MSGYKISSDDGLAYYSLSKFSDNQTIRNSTFKSYSVYSADSYSNSYISNHESSDWIVKIYFNLSTRSNTSSVAFFSDGTYSYAAQKASDNMYRFVDICDDTHFYHDLSFDSLEDLNTWFWNRVGMKTSDDSQADVYNPSNNSSVTVNKDILNSKLDEAASMAADTALSTVIAGSEAKLEEMQANPDFVTDITASDVYQSEIPLVESSSALWTTKFPFCLPFDLYNLFTGMSTTAEAPIFNITVLPKNSFGFQNEEIIWTIDFSQFDEFVKIIRFFEGATFIIFLIMTSRKLISGE